MDTARPESLSDDANAVARDDAPSTSSSDTAEDRSRNEDLIARRAYQRFEERGREHGHDLEDWLEAERELGGRGGE